MKITVYTFSTDDDDGTRSQAFGTEAEAAQAAWDWCCERCDESDLFARLGKDINDADDIQAALRLLYPDWTDLYEQKAEYLDTCNTDEHEIEIPLCAITGPAQSLDLMLETLSMDAESKAFDSELRQRLSAALESLTLHYGDDA